MAEVNKNRKTQNVCQKIINRSASGASVRQDLGILRTLIAKKSSCFSKTWSKTSKHPIGFDNQHLFFDKFRTVYKTHGLKGEPTRLYKLPQLCTKEKVESAVVFESPLDQESFQKCNNDKSFRTSMIGITANGFLLRQDLSTGEILQSVYLSSKYKFKHIFWETDLHRVAITSAHTKLPPRPVVDNRSCIFSTFMYIALFEVAPLRFLATIPINKKIFGSDVVDASASKDILFTMHQGGVMRLYSLQEILASITTRVLLGDLYNFAGDGNASSYNFPMQREENLGVIGVHPYGVPVNVNFQGKLPILLQVASHQHHVSFGGYPWHYITCPKKQSSVFQVHTVVNQTAVNNGLLTSAVQSLEQDQAYFHFDDSGRIVHVGPDFIRYWKLCVSDNLDEGQTFDLQTCHTISLQSTDKSRNLNGSVTHYTSSGRRVKTSTDSYYNDPGYEAVCDIDYEDELDLLVVLSSHSSSKGHISLYDNQTGLLIKEIELVHWDEDSDHSILMERDVIVHIFKNPSRNYFCEVYRLTI